jgi:PAS domain S-box-containing protein
MQQHHDAVGMLTPDDGGGDGRDVTTILDADATIRYVSPSIEPILGYKPEQLVGQNWFQYVHPDDAAQALPGFGQTSQQPGIVQRNALRVRHANGSWVNVEEVGSNLLHYPGVHGWILNARNVGPVIGQPAPSSARGANGEELNLAALAHVMEELLGTLTTAQLLDRLCRCVREVLQCDCCHALLFDAALDALVPVASCGDTPEQTDSLRYLRIPRTALLSWQTVSAEGDRVAGTHPLARLQRQHGIAVSVCAPLVSAGEVAGYLHIGRCSAEAPFREPERQLVTRIAHVGSRALEQALRCAALERADRWRTQFVSTLSHELRTPLNVIIGYHDLLLDGTFGALSSEQAYTLRRAHRSARELLDIITSTLDLSRLEAGRLRLVMQTIDIRELVDELARDTTDLCDKPGVALEWDVATDVPAVTTDPVKLKMVLKNLISNAVKFTDHGTVKVTVFARPGAVELAVSDTGVGIARDVLGAIFEPFQQVDAATLERYGGTGLGLYIVRQLLALLGGTIAVNSEVGAGSAFRVFIPYDRRSTGSSSDTTSR